MEQLTQIVFNVFLTMFNLIIDHNGLFYRHKLKFGHLDFFILEMNEEGVQKLAEFLELPYIPWSDDADDIFYALANSKYFNKDIFLKTIIADTRYKQFIDLVQKENPINLYKPSFTPNYRSYIVDKFFGTNITSRIQHLQELGYRKKFLKNKFNGHLVQKWVPELKPGEILKDSMEEFKDYIQNRFHTNFLEYLKERPNKAIRSDFLFYYFNDLSFFEYSEVDNELPF